MTSQLSLFEDAPPKPKRPRKPSKPVGWKVKAIRIVRKMTGEFQIEDIRRECAKRGIFPPKPCHWGGFTTDLIGLGIIEATGEWRVTRDKKTHSRTAVYRLKAKVAA